MIKFEKLPYLFRSALAAGLGIRLSAGRYGVEFSRFYAFLNDSKNYSPEEQANWQRLELIRLVKSAASGTQFYQNLQLEENGDLKSILQQLPILEKETLRNSVPQFFNENVKKWLVSSTSGTSGSPMKVEHCKSSMQRRFALLKQHLEISGVGRNSPSVRLSGRILCDPSKNSKKPWLLIPTENQLLLSTYHLNSAHAKVIAKKLISFKPEVMDGYSSGILEALRLLASVGVKLESLKVIITTAETMSPAVREELEELSGAKILDYYSASEGVPIIQQCRFGCYHVRWESGVFEVLKNNKINAEGSGELLITSFIQDRTPLIRYRTGDYVDGLDTHNQASCKCGLKTPTIKGIEGRIEDMVFVKGGGRLGMFTYRTIKEVSGLEEAQVIQKDYDRFKVIAVLKGGVDIDSVRLAIKDKFERALGYSISLDFESTDKIKKGANGKSRLLINEMSIKLEEKV